MPDTSREDVERMIVDLIVGIRTEYHSDADIEATIAMLRALLAQRDAAVALLRQWVSGEGYTYETWQFLDALETKKPE